MVNIFWRVQEDDALAGNFDVTCSFEMPPPPTEREKFIMECHRYQMRLEWSLEDTPRWRWLRRRWLRSEENTMAWLVKQLSDE